MTKTWNPTSLEQRCLQQLDHAENWRMLDREKPSEDEVLPWKPFGRIFGFNLAVFGPVISVVFLAISLASGTDRSELLHPDNLIPGIGFILVTSLLMALFAASLYRRSWNRRARYFLRRAEETGD